jgi:hypothetical protein
MHTNSFNVCNILWKQGKKGKREREEKERRKENESGHMRHTTPNINAFHRMCESPGVAAW